MCNSTTKPTVVATTPSSSPPTKPLKKTLQRSLTAPLTSTPTPKLELKKRAKEYSPNSSTENKPLTPRLTPRVPTIRKKSKKTTPSATLEASIGLKNIDIGATYEPGSIAAAQRENVSLRQAQRKSKIAHYGRTPEKIDKDFAGADATNVAGAVVPLEEKRCSFVTKNSDALYVAYHDEEWGVPVHDDRMLFELLVLSGAQVDLDWTTILKKRDDFRLAFAEFDVDVVSKFTEKHIASISSKYDLDLGKVRGIVDNSKRVLEVVKQYGTLDKYIWSFVNHKPITTNYKSCRKIPVKTSKSESISKDMVKKGFRFVGPTVIHSFMQAAGLTNDHLISCPRHLLCSNLN